MTLSSYKFQLERRTLLGTCPVRRSRSVQALRDCVVQTAFVALAWDSFVPKSVWCVFSYVKQRHGAALSFMSGMSGGRGLARVVLSLK